MCSKDHGLQKRWKEGEGQELLGELGKVVTKPHRIDRNSPEGNMEVSLTFMMFFPFFINLLPPSCLVFNGIFLLFTRIYRYQSHDYAFSSVEKLLHAVGGDEFLGLLNRTLHETLQKAGFSEKFLNEMIAPVMRVNYGQSTDVSAFVGKPGLEKVMHVCSQKNLVMLGWLLSLGHRLEKAIFLKISDIAGYGGTHL